VPTWETVLFLCQALRIECGEFAKEPITSHESRRGGSSMAVTEKPALKKTRGKRRKSQIRISAARKTSFADGVEGVPSFGAEGVARDTRITPVRTGRLLREPGPRSRELREGGAAQRVLPEGSLGRNDWEGSFGSGRTLCTDGFRLTYRNLKGKQSARSESPTHLLLYPNSAHWPSSLPVGGVCSDAPGYEGASTPIQAPSAPRFPEPSPRASERASSPTPGAPHSQLILPAACSRWSVAGFLVQPFFFSS
jgi:hypothetical protein